MFFFSKNMLGSLALPTWLSLYRAHQSYIWWNGLTLFLLTHWYSVNFLNMIMRYSVYLGHSFMKDFGSPFLFWLPSSLTKKQLFYFLRLTKLKWFRSQHETFIEKISTAKSASYKCPFSTFENNQVLDKTSLKIRTKMRFRKDLTNETFDKCQLLHFIYVWSDGVTVRPKSRDNWGDLRNH